MMGVLLLLVVMMNDGRFTPVVCYDGCFTPVGCYDERWAFYSGCLL